MGSRHPPLAALYLLGLLGEYPFWGVFWGTWAQGTEKKVPESDPLSLIQARMSPLWSSTEGWGHQDPCLLPQPQLGSWPCLSHPQGPTSASLLHCWGPYCPLRGGIHANISLSA